MTTLQQAATAFVQLYEFLREVFGSARALIDRALQQARRDYLQEKAAC